jgi:hypothetical protein
VEVPANPHLCHLHLVGSEDLARTTDGVVRRTVEVGDEFVSTRSSPVKTFESKGGFPVNQVKLAKANGSGGGVRLPDAAEGFCSSGCTVGPGNAPDGRAGDRKDVGP